jgi:hypothetical protein
MNFSTQLRLMALAAFLGHVTAATSFASSYVVEGVTLGERIQFDKPTYRSYGCKPSDDFEGFTWCERTQTRTTSLGRGTFSTTIMHSGDGTTAYLMANIAPVTLKQSDARAEIDSLSKELNEQPRKIEWYGSPSSPTAVISVWGKIELTTQYHSERPIDLRERLRFMVRSCGGDP